jgi:L-iditol 2-dehydrogenase
MRAALVYAQGDLRPGEAEKPKPGPNEVLIRIEVCGVCPSDVRFYAGTGGHAPRHLPYTPGHEWAGVIEELGEGITGFAVGDRVVPNWRVICGSCYYCGRGMSNYCQNIQHGKVRGGFAEYGAAPVSNVYKIPDGTTFEEASFAEPLACCLNGNENTRIRMGDDVVVVGTGPIGLLHIQLAKAAGGRVIAVDRIASRLEMASKLGASAVIDGSVEDPIARIKSLTDGRGANAVIVAVGSGEAAKQALEMTCIGASVNLFAGFYPPTTFPLDPNIIHYKELNLTGSHDFEPYHFRTALKFISDKTVRVEPLISHRLSLEETKQGFDAVIGRQGLKVMIHTSR